MASKERVAMFVYSLLKDQIPSSRIEDLVARSREEKYNREDFLKRYSMVIAEAILEKS